MPGDFRGVASLGRRLVEVRRLPGEAVAQRVPRDPEELATAMGARHVAVDEVTGTAVAGAVRQSR